MTGNQKNMNKIYMNSEYLKLDMGPMFHYNIDSGSINENVNDVQKGGFINVASSAASLANVLKDLVVPASLVYIQNKTTSSDIANVSKEVKLISEELYDNVLSIVDYTSEMVGKGSKLISDKVKKTKETRRKRKSSNKTRKNRRN